MPLRNAKPVRIQPAGLSDSDDGTNAFPGAMAVLQDLIPNPSTRFQFVPRPASVSAYNFSDFTTPANGEALLVVGTRAYGFIASARYAGKSEPFCYDLAVGAIVALANVTSANCPTTQSTTGDWTPPSLAMIGTKLVMTHPGYNKAGGYFVGWIDLTNFTSNTITGTTHTNTTLDGLSTNVLAAGWQIGYHITGPDIPANTYIVAIAAGGLSVTLSNAATGGHAGGTYTVTSGTTAAPLYGAGQTQGQPLVDLPAAVGQFNGRAYYAVDNSLPFSDSGIPLQITNASQALILGDNTPVTALGGLPLTSQLTGGIVQALVAFKGGEELYQVTGDPATNNLTVNAIAGSMGTKAANTVISTPAGLAYIAQDGLRIIGPTGQPSPPVGVYGQGINVPFVNAINPSRMCAAYNHNLIRVSVQNGAVNGQPIQEYWYDLSLQVWTGPHSFPAAMISAYDGDLDTFIMFAAGVNAKLWQSDPQPLASSTYTENGVAMSWVWQPCLSPDNAVTAMNAVVRALIGLEVPASLATTFTASDEQGNTLDTITLSGSGVGGSIWNSFNWGAADWGFSVANYQQYQLNFHQPLVFKQMSLRVNGASIAGFAIGNLYFEYQELGYPVI